VKRADYILTHYSYKWFDYVFTAVIAASFVALLVMRYGFGAFGVEASWFIAWLRNTVV
jgi:hypothetical protein